MSDDPKSFSSFDLDPRLSRAIVQLKFTQPTPVQAKVIPVALAGKDILARARTGSGKTAAFVVPIVQKILQSKDASSEPSIKALILVPTRELAEQVTAHVRKFIIYAKNEIKVVNLAGQMSPQQQRPLLAEKPDIVVSTPSRALAHLEAGNMDLKSSLQNLVIDEADLVLSFGYDEDVRKILTYLPKIYQSFLMSATLTEDIENLKQMILRKPVVLSLEDQCDEAQFLTQYVIKCNEFEKFLYTFIIIKLRLISGKVLLFVNDIDRCYKLKLFLEQFSIKSCVLNSELPLNSRYHIVEEFNRGIYQYLIASDEADLKGEMDTDDEDEGDDNDQQQSKDNGNSAAKKKSKQVRDKEYGVSRGIDFQDVTAVINFDFPKSAKSYTHRVGRTARGGQRGIAMSFVVTKEHMHVDKDVVKDVSRGRDVCDDKVLARVERLQQSKNAQLKPYTFEKKNVEGFKYRVQDALHTVNKAAIKEARITEIKREILNSEKLKAHFEDKPKDLEFLRHDKALQPARVKEHLRNIPSYLMPRVSVPSRAHNNSKFDGPVPFESDKKRKKSGHKKGPAKKRKTDPLKSIKKHR